MYDWLTSALADDGTVVTANRRLARELAAAYAKQQVAAGELAWRSPKIHAWQDWLAVVFDAARDDGLLPVRINSQQSQLLWEQCLRRECKDAGAGLASLAKMARDTWQRMADWQVPVAVIARTARSEDHKIFAVVAGRYLARLEKEHWIDDAGLGEVVLGLIRDQRIAPFNKIAFAGFERRRPLTAALADALRETGTIIGNAPDSEGKPEYEVFSFDNESDEYRAAGAWALAHVTENPAAHIAIVANGLDKYASAIARQVRDGAVPGWQYGPDALAHLVNVSYGQRLADYPAVAIALLLLRWIDGELGSTDVSLLLRSPLLGSADVAGRSRLELLLRTIPDRSWSPSMVTAELRGKEDSDAASDFLAKLAAFSKRRRELPSSAPPAIWVERVDEILQAFGWPGEAALDSAEFQLINRWRELLNEFAKLGTVVTRMNRGAAVSKLAAMAAEVVFQPEATGSSIQLLGPLEAAGLQFDAIWITGVSASQWPPAARPLPLVSRQLQRDRDMPDATPGDTVFFARKMLHGLLASGVPTVCSYPRTVDDEEQTISDLLQIRDGAGEEAGPPSDPHARELLRRAVVIPVADSVPSVTAGERIAGGAATVQLQINDPLAAFIQGRLRARAIYPQAVGITPLMRGNLIHDALHELYLELPDSDTLGGWTDAERTTRIESATERVFARHRGHSGAVLDALLRLEQRRIAALLQRFIVADSDREPFQVTSLESKFEFVHGLVRLPLRFDRIDSLPDGGIAILDYKTGTQKRLVDAKGEAVDVQLFVYAAATDARVSALALVNVDTREITFEGAGAGYTDIELWPDLLRRVTNEIREACDRLAAGDVRINNEQSLSDARPLNLLTRYTELRHEDG